ncbi:aminotransferase class III-fold pyridoxal phosphate-dependent enzyme [Marinicellulosiphila megalodicopiae]|uniref:aminotransferase class III-fold pyridoxal phosphate-dependent enzyme n=1 Tax=Marinicellulosiphila megalodicopiae TaxID=2724896 RepID=UPI003BAE395E
MTVLDKQFMNEDVKELDLTQSIALAEKNKQYIAGFTQSMMKKPEQFALGKFPVFIKSGHGAVVEDLDGNQYVDFICGLGANMLGHNHPVVNHAILENLTNGILHSLPAPVEAKTAERLVNMIPNAQMTRFFKTGADANSAAIRLARYHNKKNEIITVGYNGWHDHFMYDTPGVPESLESYTTRLPLFTPPDEAKLFEAINQKHESLSAVLLSVPYNRELSQEFFKTLRTLCTEKNVLLIIDEVVTGFRLARGGVQEYFNVNADLVTFSKGIAAGMPLSAVTGSTELMNKLNDLQVSTTFGGEMLSLEVCDAVLKEYQESDYISHIHQLGKRLKDGVNSVAQSLNVSLKVVGYDCIPMFLFAPNPVEHVKMAEPFLAAMAKRGVIMRRDVNFICTAHTVTQIDQTIESVKGALQEMIKNGSLTVQ